MLSILISLVAAMIFSFATYAIYGLQGVMTLQWIDTVFWAIIATGFIIGGINTLWQCLPCKVGKLIHSSRFTDTFCGICRH